MLDLIVKRLYPNTFLGKLLVSAYVTSLKEMLLLEVEKVLISGFRDFTSLCMKVEVVYCMS